MANTTEPFRREGDNSWNSLLEAVNDILQNPPSGCSPIDPIPLVEECHRWSRDDIIEVHNKLIETCDQISFEDPEVCTKWLKSLIDDIEAVYDQTWCDCSQQCHAPCDNAADPETIFLTSVTLDDEDCTNDNSASCSSCCDDSGTGFDEWEALIVEWTDINNDLCVLEDEVDALQATKDSVCGADPGSAECATATSELNAKIAERDAKQTEWNNKRDAINNKGTLQRTNFIACNSGFDDIESLLTLITQSVPWTNYLDCEQRAECAQDDIDLCRASWILESRLNCLDADHGVANAGCTTCVCSFIPNPQNWRIRVRGSWGPSGDVVPGRCSLGCPDIFKYKNVGGCPQGCVQINGLNCKMTEEYRLRITYPQDFSPFCCNTFESCTPGQPNQCQESSEEPPPLPLS